MNELVRIAARTRCPPSSDASPHASTSLRLPKLYLIMKSVFRLAARRQASPRGSVIGIRAGEGKTDWTKPLPPLWLWALNAGGSLLVRRACEEGGGLE
jgi:hypothetical protein